MRDAITTGIATAALAVGAMFFGLVMIVVLFKFFVALSPSCNITLQGGAQVAGSHCHVTRGTLFCDGVAYGPGAWTKAECGG